MEIKSNLFIFRYMPKKLTELLLLMAEFVVSFVLERLSNLAIEESKLLHGVSFQVEQIKVELQRMQCFLRDADARRTEGERVRNWVIEVREIAYEVEDVIEVFVIRLASRRRREGAHNFLERYILNEFIYRRKVGSKIEAIKTRISGLTTSLQTYGIRAVTEGEGSSSNASAYQRQGLFRWSYSHDVEGDFVGLEEDVEKLVALLVNEDDYQTVSICGMGGLGKTTLAQKVYNHRNAKRHFDGFAWACISQQWLAKDVLQRILVELIPEKREQIVQVMREEELVRLLLQVLQDKKCLVVLDDIWSEAVWDCLKHAIPSRKMGSKILITTRNKEVALRVDPHGFIHEPRHLNEDEGWELLQKKALASKVGTCHKVEKNMEKLGREMVRHCGGLPLAVVVLGGILVTKHTFREWEMVHRNIGSYIMRGKGIQQHGGVSNVLALSYSDLPYQLKPCFLYLGGVPEDSKIEADKLYQLWMAEGMVSLDDQRAHHEETMMEVAERYLGELAQRYMVQVQVGELTGRFKSCCLHDLMRDLCLSKVKEENFLKVIDFRHENEKLLDSSSSSCKLRRLAIYLDKGLDKCVFPESKTAHPLRSVLFFAPNQHLGLPMPGLVKSHLKDFKVLRVLHLDRLVCSKNLAKAIGKLIHLRYLSLKNSGLRKLPSSIGNLGCLQTLDVRHHGLFSASPTIPNVLWKMKSLRHLYLHDTIGAGKKLRLDGLSNLEILETFNTHHFDVKDLLKLVNLFKLRAHIKVEFEDLVPIINYLSITANKLRHSSIDIDYNFSSEEALTLLEQLLECHHLNTLHIKGVIGKLPEPHHFSPSLTGLNLSKSELREDPMATLEKLPNLRSLVLGYQAFVGVDMVCSKMGFPQLKFLQLRMLSNLEEWRVDEGAMYNLSSLEVLYCRRLKMVPDGLRFISTLQEFKITNMSEAFQRRLQVVDGEEGADLYKIQHVPSVIFSHG